MKVRRLSPGLLLCAAAATLAACSGGPSSPSEGGIVLRGTVVGAVAGSASAQSQRAGSAAEIIVTVEQAPTITAKVGADGSFTLRGLPEGRFTLIFSMNGVTLGSVAFAEVKPNQEIIVTVSVTGGSVVVLEERRNGIGHGDLEIEGLVAAVLVLDPNGESRFLIDGRTVLARPGETSIREGNARRSVSDVAVGRRVHVKGVWLEMSGTTQPVLAHEIKLQGDDADDDDGNGKSCMINGGRVGDGIELEGNVATGGSSGFMLQVEGNRARGPVQVDTSGATFQCSPASGPNAPTPAQCMASVKPGAKVHVSGMLASCDAGMALARASRVKIQK